MAYAYKDICLKTMRKVIEMEKYTKHDVEKIFKTVYGADYNGDYDSTAFNLLAIEIENGMIPECFTYPRYSNTGKKVNINDCVSYYGTYMYVTDISFNNKLQWVIGMLDKFGKRSSFTVEDGLFIEYKHVVVKDADGNMINCGDTMYNKNGKRLFIKKLDEPTRKALVSSGYDSNGNELETIVEGKSLYKEPPVFDAEGVRIKKGDKVYDRKGNSTIVKKFEYWDGLGKYNVVGTDDEWNGIMYGQYMFPCNLLYIGHINDDVYHHEPYYTYDGMLIHVGDVVYGKSDMKKWTVDSISDTNYPITAHDDDGNVRDLKAGWLLPEDSEDVREYKNSFVAKYGDAHGKFAHDKFVGQGYLYCPMCGKFLGDE